MNSICHDHNIAFLAGDVFGLFSWCFADFGAFQCIDPDGENPKTAFVAGVTQDKEGVISLVDNKRHDLQDGDIIRVTEVVGMTELNNREFKITNKGPYQLGIGDTSSFSPYVKSGFIEQVKVPQTITFEPLASFFGKAINPELVLLGDLSKFDRTAIYPIFLQALFAYYEKYGRLPNPGSEAESLEVFSITESIAKDSSITLDEAARTWIPKLARGAAGIVSPMASILGGIMGQEIIKACSSKYTPLKQFLFFDAEECLPTTLPTEQDCKPIKSRYDGQIAVFGEEFNQKIHDLKYFLVGAGAIGCEVLKCWAMMGVGTGKNGKVYITDMDTIEISNLNRQFLYRSWDVQKFKSQVSAEAAKRMNSAMNIDAWTVRVGPETEDTYNDAFWQPLSGVCNALDNIKARLYVDEKCIFYRKSLLESGTQGTKGNVQVVVPSVTESYGSSVDPPTPETPVCLLHSFPNNIEHCLQWGRELVFEGLFVKEPEITNNYVTKANFLETLPPNLKLTTLEILDRTVNSRVSTFDDCIKWARNQFEEYYVNKTKLLLHNFPLDYVDTHGTPFWTGSKRPPTPLDFDVDNPLHVDFVVAATFLKAYTSKIVDSEFKPSDFREKVEYIKSVALKTDVVKFVPKKVKITTDENAKEEATQYTDEDEKKSKIILDKLAVHSNNVNTFAMNPISFEKDNDNNFHIDFIHAAANLRAAAYGIKIVGRLESKLIAGKIVPAIVTTTASVVGFVNLELYKLVAQKKRIEDYRNTFLNIALPFIGQAEPLPPVKKSFGKNTFTLWDRIDIKQGDITLGQLLQYFRKKYEIEIDMLGVGSALIFASWMASKTKERLPKKITEIVREVTQKPLPPSPYLMLEPTATDLDGNDIDDLPRICYWYKK